MNKSEIESTCWNFSNDEQVPFPIIQGIISNLQSNISISIDLKVDTGFNGVLGLPQEAIEELQLASGGHSLVRSATGVKRLEYYEINISIPKTPYANIKAIAYKTSRALVGRMILNLGSWLYDGKDQKLCFI